MANKINFTKAALLELQIKFSKRLEVYDSKQPHLMAELRSPTSLSFYLYKRIDGPGPTKYRLGKFPGMSVEQARTQTVKLLGRIANGENPAHERRLARVEHTLSALFHYWLESHAKPHRRTWAWDQRRYELNLAHWGNRRLSSISQREVQSLHAKIGKDRGKYLANRVIELLRALYNKGAAIGYRGDNPADKFKPFDEVDRDRFLLRAELPAFMRALQQEPQQYQDFFLLCLFTGARRGNVQAMKWEDIRLADAVWRIPFTKNDEPHLVHLPPPAVEILKRRQEDAGNSSWVFPAHSATGHMQEPKKVWSSIIENSGLKDLRIHDLRRTLGSWQALGGSSLPVIGKSLGHKSQTATAIYARLSMEPVIESVDRATNAILDAAQPKSKRKGTRNGKS